MEILSRNFSNTFYTYNSIWPFFWRVVIICLGSFYFGYTYAYFGVIKCYDSSSSSNNLSYSFRVIYFFLQGLPSLTAIIGCILHIQIIKYFSRKNTLVIAGIIGCLGTGIVLIDIQPQYNIDNFVSMPSIWIGRVIQGISMGIFSTICPLFIKQFVPVELSVNLGVLHQLIMSFGTLSVKVMNITNTPYWLLFAFPLPFLTLLIVIVMTVFRYQSPNYYLSINKQEMAKSFFQELYLEDLHEQLFLDAKTAYKIEHQDNSVINGDFDMEIISKKALAIGIYVAILQQVSGISYIILYGSEPNRCTSQKQKPPFSIPFQVGWSLFESLCTLSLVLFNASCCPPEIKKTSRRRVLFQIGTIFSSAFMLVSICLLPPFNSVQNHYLVIEILIFFFMGCYGLTLGPTTWLFLSEILDGNQMAIAMSYNWVVRFVIVFCFPLMGSVNSNNKEILFVNLIILLPITIVCIYLNFKYIVETKNRTRLDIIRDLDAIALPFKIKN